MIVWIICSIIVILLYSAIENRFIKTEHYVLLKNKDGSIGRISSRQNVSGECLSIVQLSDLHDCRFGKENTRLLDKITACKPDVILLTGDMLNKYQQVKEDIFAFYEKLSQLCPCIYSLGNHELKERERYPERFDSYIKKVKECGIIVSDNQSHRLQFDKSDYYVASYSSELKQYKKFVTEKTEKTQSADWILTAEQAELTVLLSHDPELAELYCETKYSVVFCGHLHGGIVRIPGFRGIVSTRFVLFPKYDGGCYQLNETHIMVVSRGLGSHTVKFRLFNRPEVVHTEIYIEK